MLLAETIFGFLGMLLFATMAYYTIEILRNIWKHEEFSMSQFFLKTESVNAFRVLVISAMLFSVGMIVAAFALILDIPLLEDMSKLGSIVLFGGYVYFLVMAKRITTKEDKDQ